MKYKKGRFRDEKYKKSEMKLKEFLKKDDNEFDTLYLDKDNTGHFKILDPELDTIEGTCNYDGCVRLDVSQYSYIFLSRDNLDTLYELICEHEIIINEQSK